MVLEARDRVGGRVLGHPADAGSYDLGPAWIWPAVQPRIAALVASASLDVYEQVHDGAMLYEDPNRRVQRFERSYAQEPPSMRVRGGITALVRAVMRDCAAAAIRLRSSVQRIAVHEAGVEVSGEGPQGPFALRARRVALAMPPRLVRGIALSPALPLPLSAYLDSVPTWMAGHAKALMIVDHAHWRQALLSGSAISRAGPLGEIHDASLPGATDAALFGFFSWDARQRAQRGAALRDDIAGQLVNLFGPAAARPCEILIKDWARDPLTSCTADGSAGGSHPDYQPVALPPPWEDRLILSGSESAPEFGGYLEGALAAADMASDWALGRVQGRLRHEPPFRT